MNKLYFARSLASLIVSMVTMHVLLVSIYVHVGHGAHRILDTGPTPAVMYAKIHY